VIHIARIFIYGIASALLMAAVAVFMGFDPNPTAYSIAAMSGSLFRFAKELEIEYDKLCCPSEDKK
jgi:hypothetical protein